MTVSSTCKHSLCVLILCFAIKFPRGEAWGLQKTDEAYVTLLYGDEFLLGVRVLGKSIRDTGSTKNMVALVSDGVSSYGVKLLKADGWIVNHISLLENPNQVRPKRFWGVYTKLKIFNMTNYKKVVYLDADTIVIKNIDDLFKCGKFCANLKHSERLNSGVMVVHPSEAVFNDMMKKVKTLPSYTGGDQGFLNSYFDGFPNAHIFDPSVPYEVINSRPSPGMERLSTLYNADVGLYTLSNKWMVEERRLCVIHYTLGPLKPWDWWTSWLLKPVDIWQNVRSNLEETLPGTGGGRNPNDDIIVKFLFLLPLLTLFFWNYRRLFLQARELFTRPCRSSLCDYARHLYYKLRLGGLSYSTIAASSSPHNPDRQEMCGSGVPKYLGGISVVVAFTCVSVAVPVSLLIVPRQTMPWTGLVLMYEWSFAIFFTLFGGLYLSSVYLWGRRSASTLSAGSLDFESGKGHHHGAASRDSLVLLYWLQMGLTAISAPLLPSLFGVTALFRMLGMMAAGVVAFAAVVTYSSNRLASRSFLRGLCFSSSAFHF